jgi:hypothetical protein
MYEIVREPIILSTLYGDMNVQVFPRGRIVPESMVPVRGNRYRLSSLKTAVPAIDLVTKNTGEDVEGLSALI